MFWSSNPKLWYKWVILNSFALSLGFLHGSVQSDQVTNLLTSTLCIFLLSEDTAKQTEEIHTIYTHSASDIIPQWPNSQHISINIANSVINHHCLTAPDRSYFWTHSYFITHRKRGVIRHKKGTIHYFIIAKGGGGCQKIKPQQKQWGLFIIPFIVSAIAKRNPAQEQQNSHKKSIQIWHISPKENSTVVLPKVSVKASPLQQSLQQTLDNNSI